MSETVKKTKAPAKPRSAATKGKKTLTTAENVTTITSAHGPSREQIAELAHKFWAERGRQHGFAEQDWLRAERELRGKAS
jgi:hypothetical protein